MTNGVSSGTRALPLDRGQPRKHGGVPTFSKPESWHTPDQATTCDTTRYGTAEALAWDRMHPRLQARGPWPDHCGELPLIHGTLIRLKVDRLPGDRDPKPVWLWSSRTAMTGGDVNLRWQAFLRRFDLEHTFRLFKQTLGWTVPKVRDPHTADLWTWLIIAAHTQLRLALPSPKIFVGPGNGRRSLVGSPLPGSVGGSATSA
jgi:hypothetical protein